MMKKGVIVKVFFCTLCVSLVLLWIGKAVAAEKTAQLISFRGQVQVLMPSSPDWQKASHGMSLSAGSLVRTGEDGVASLLMADETLIKLNRNTRFLIKEARNNAG